MDGCAYRFDASGLSEYRAQLAAGDDLWVEVVGTVNDSTGWIAFSGEPRVVVGPSRRRRAVTGNRRTLMVRVVAQDTTTTSTKEQLAASAFGGSGDLVNLRSQYLACSDNQLDFQPVLSAVQDTDPNDNIENGVVEVNLSLLFLPRH